MSTSRPRSSHAPPVEARPVRGDHPNASIRVPTASPRPNEILVRVLVNGTCASDLPTWRGERDLATPAVLGYEPVGRVIGPGAGVDRLVAGDPVIGRLANSFADLTVVSAADAVATPSGLASESAIRRASWMHGRIGMPRSRADTGDRVAVIGLGFMGLALLQFLALHRRRRSSRSTCEQSCAITHRNTRPQRSLAPPGFRT